MKLHIDPALLDKVKEQSNPLLNVPADAQAGRNKSFRWPELLSISRVAKADVDKGRVELLVNYRVSLVSQNPSNRGKTTRSRFLINMDAREGTGDHTMTMISLANIHNLIRAATPAADFSSGLDLELYFDEQESPLIGAEIVATIVDKPDRDDPEIRRQDIQRFAPLT